MNESKQSVTTYYVSPYYEVMRLADGSEVHTKYVLGLDGVVASITKQGSAGLSAQIQNNNITLLPLSGLSLWGRLGRSAAPYITATEGIFANI